ncbi:MAG: lysine--tRNA ligase, partial [Candidatus Glassbacteria bacterium]|nr:lysine--tRNA ligase [Candidatus Glassbacteria bacterium]
MEDRHELVKIRLEKVERLRELGVNPYPYSFEATVSAKAAVEGYEDGEHPEQGGRVCLAGRVVSLRSKGKVTFAHLDDGEGRIQVYLRRDAFGEQSYEVVKLLDIGDFIGVSGYLFRTHAGEVTVYVEQLTLLAKSIRQLPIVKEKVVDDRKVVYDKVEDKELRYRQRYVDLIVNPEVKEIFRIRAQVISTMRGFLDRRGFLEVETPVLQPVYGGATARPFTTDHKALNTRLFLRISNELYLKRLIIGGFNKVYEFSRDFRNEGLDRKHNPEFTMLEFYQAYADY